MNADEHLEDFKSFIKANGNSPNVQAMYFKRVRTFLEKRPEAMDAGEQDLRDIVDDYIASLPVTSGIGVTATAVRYYWTMRFGKQYFERFSFDDYDERPEIEAEIAEFGAWLEKSGHLSRTTINQRSNKVKRYLYVMLGDGSFDRSKVDLASVADYLSGPCSRLSAATKSGFTTELRSYARFLCDRGFDASAGPITKVAFRGPAHSDPLPPYVLEDDIAAVSEYADTSTPRGKRDLAMLLMMANLGLRRSDVALLDLDDVDWANGILRITDSKSISDRSIPLDAETGSALEDYVVNGRPTAAGTRALFLPDGLERRGDRMTFQQVGGAVTLLSQKAGVQIGGTHAFRHSVATNMVNAGVPPKPVADLLGHESIETTMGYARVNMASLRKAACAWPGEVAL